MIKVRFEFQNCWNNITFWYKFKIKYFHSEESILVYIEKYNSTVPRWNKNRIVDFKIL